MRFKTDENLHPEVAALLRRRGRDAVTVWDQDMRGRADAEIAAVCQRENRILVTLDLDFADIRAYPPNQYPGLLVLRVDSQSCRHVLEVIDRILPVLARDSAIGRLWIADERRIRVRGGER